MANINYSKPTKSKMIDRMKMNPALTWLSDMTKLLATSIIKIPSSYRGRVLGIKKLLESDVSGMVNTVLDFSIDAALVDYQVNTKNKNLAKKLNLWLDNINLELRGSIPVGVKALAKEYFRERWKGSSFLLLRTFWEEKDGFYIPTIMYFVDGEDILVENNDSTRNLNGKSYRLRISETESKPLGKQKDEKLFIQRPYSSWGTEYPNPFLIQRGIFKNLSFLAMLEEKGEFVVGKALEYLAILKKGSEQMTMSNNPDFIYSEEDLTKIKSDFSKFLSDRKNSPGTSVYTTNFDTELEHSIPEYKRALQQELYAPIEKRIMGGLGLVDIVQGLTSTRRESVLNPKPLFSEIKTGVEDFKMLLVDIMSTIAEANSESHRKYFRQDIKISSSIIKEELTDKMITQYRSAHDRGAISKRTYDDILGVDIDIEIERMKEEEKHPELYPPVTQRNEDINVNREPLLKTDEDKKDEKTQLSPENKKARPLKNEDVPDDKKGPEKKNFNQSKEVKGGIYGEPEDPRKEVEVEKGKLVKKKDGWYVVSESDKNLGGPYKTKKEAKKRLRQVEFYKNKGNVEDLIEIKELEILGKKEANKRLRQVEFYKNKGNVEDLIEIKELEILGKKEKVLDRLLEESDENI